LNSLFCRHNRFTADCPICSKGTLLDSSAAPARPRKSSSGSGSGGTRRARASEPAARTFTGPYASAGPYERDGARYDVRLEKVPGGVRLGQWAGGALQKAAPVLRAADVPTLIAAARERSVLAERDQEALERALEAEPTGGGGTGDAGTSPGSAGTGRGGAGASPGRAGDMREELRVEADGEGMLRIARWLYRPNFGWELQEAPVMLPAKRYAEALRNAAKAGLLLLVDQPRSTSAASPSTSRSTLTTPT
jgi:hypothetical protein